MRKKFLVTGGAGFIGTTLVEYLIAKGHDVAVFDNFSTGKRERLPDTAHVHVGDILDTDALCTAARGVDAVLHLAALPSVQGSIEDPSGTHRVNVDGTLSVLEAVRTAGVPRVVFTSSSAVYGDIATFPTPEAAPLSPKSPYALHKLMGEQYMQLWSELYNIETVSLRLYNVYGPNMDPNGAYAAVIARFLQLRAEKKALTITGDGEQTRDFVHVADVARAFLCAAESATVGAGERVNIGSGVSASINEVARLVGGEVTYLPARVEPTRSEADIANAQRSLKWSPEISLPEGLASLT